MLYIRHAVGSRLFCEPKEYEIKSTDNESVWEISFITDRETADTLLEFHEELNIFEAEGNQKTWYYSSEGDARYIEDESKFKISADRKTVYTV
ncbi:hypothetical protein ACWV26_10985 [Rummeliibacillus sp. JY-2-4R]